MICKSCRRKDHGVCKGKTRCDCQHKIGSKWINKKRVTIERPGLASDDAASRGVGAT